MHQGNNATICDQEIIMKSIYLKQLFANPIFIIELVTNKDACGG